MHVADPLAKAGGEVNRISTNPDVGHTVGSPRGASAPSRMLEPLIQLEGVADRVILDG
jgi:hypothetical protein